EVAHDLQLERLPPEHALFDQHFADPAAREAFAGDAVDAGFIEREAAPRAAEHVRGTHDDGGADLLREHARLVERVRPAAPWKIDAGFLHALLEETAVFAAADRVEARADQLHVELLERAALRKLDRDVQCGLSAEGRE